MMVTFVEIGNIGKKTDVAYFGAFRRQTVKKHKNDQSEQGGGRGGKIPGN